LWKWRGLRTPGAIDRLRGGMTPLFVYAVQSMTATIRLTPFLSGFYV